MAISHRQRTAVRKAALDLIRAQAPAYSPPPRAAAPPSKVVPLFVADAPRSPPATAQPPWSLKGRVPFPAADTEVATDNSVVHLAPFYVADDKLRWPLARLQEQYKHLPPDPMPIEKALHTLIGPNVYFFDRKKHWALVRVGPLVFLNFNW